MLADMDDACNKAGIQSDAVLAAHAHCYQRFTRNIRVNKKLSKIPYYVVGTGGRGVTHVEEATGEVVGDHVFESSLKGYGYLTMTASRSQLKFIFTQVENSGARKKFDKEVSIDLKKHRIT